MDWVKQQITVLCKIVRQDAIPLTDSFNFTDFIINSPLGRYDGDIYRAYFQTVVGAHEPGVLASYYKSSIWPVLNRERDDDDVLELDDD